MELSESTQIVLDADEFADDPDIFRIATIVSMYAERERAEYRQTEKRIKRGLLEIDGYWSETVPWYEWISEPQVLETCVADCKLPIDQLAAVIAYQIRPSNWQVFSWMSMALQGREGQEVLTVALSRHTEQIAKYKADRRKGAATKLANDEKQKYKATIRVCWDAWQKNPDDYESKSAFALDMLKQFTILKNQRVITGWCLDWERETKKAVR